MPARILLVEDAPTILELLRTRLEADGHEVLAAPDGERALEVLRAQDPDVMVADVILPGTLTGMDLLRAVREEATATEVVVMTSDATVEMAIECLRAGAVDLLRKPFQPEELSAAIAAALERQQEHATRGLLQASEAVLAAKDPDRLPEVIVRTATEVMKCTGSLLLPGADGKLYVAHAFGMAPEIQANVAIALGERVAGRVALERKPALLQDLSGDPRFSGLAPSPQVRSSIVWPLAVGERLLGVLALNRGGGEPRFRRADLHRAAMLASMIQLALENARLLRQTVAAERLASLGTIASSITHEINNPLTYVLGNLERAQDMLGGTPAPTAEELLELLADAVEGTERIGFIVRDMRTIARSGQGEGEEAVFDVADAVRSALRLSGAVLRTCAEVDLDLAEGARVRGSAGQLSQVFVNLFVNAAHAIREGKAGDGRVKVATRIEDGKVVAEVSDNGKGIADRDRARLFEPFFTTRGATSGTGLGLWISRELLRRHKGNIEAASGGERGALFRVTLPLESVARPVPVCAPRPDVKKPRVLCVDDEEPILRIYKRVFDSVYDLELAVGGKRAWELIKGGAHFDAVVCDLMMPDLTGIQLYRQVTDARPDLAGLFVFVTGSSYHPEVTSFMATCKSPVLEKPTSMADLGRTIAQVMGRAATA